MIIKQLLIVSFLSLLLLNVADGYSQDDLSDCIPSYRKGYCLHTLKKADSLVDSSTYKEIDPTNANLIDISQMNLSQFLYVGKKAYYRNIQKFMIAYDKTKALALWKNFFRNKTFNDDLAFEVKTRKFYRRGVNEKFNLFIERKFIGKFTCPKGFLTYHQEVKTTCFKPFTGFYNYKQCLHQCISARSQAAVFESSDQLNFLKNNIHNIHGSPDKYDGDHLNYNGWWIGTRLPDHKGHGYTVRDLYNIDGSPVHYYSFARGEPNGGANLNGDERCVQIFFRSSAGGGTVYNIDKWNDYFCYRKIYGCLCRTQPDRT